MPSARLTKAAMITATIACALTMLNTTSASGQEDRRLDPPEATFYRDMGFNGPAVRVDGERPDLGLAWPVNSIRVRNGRWEMCEQRNFRGRCTTVDRDTPVLGSVIRGITVQSIRPVGNWGGGGWNQDPQANDQSTRGNFAQFHTQPSEYGRRIRSCPSGNATASCAARTADLFCRRNGWNGSAREHQETVGRHVYLADVLCVRSGY